MRIPIAMLTTVIIGVTLPAGSALAQRATDAEQHEQHEQPRPAATTASAQAPAMPPMRAGMHDMSEMMAKMHANDAKLDQLVRKMQSATGSAKTEAAAELLTALVDDRKNVCEPMMAHMMKTMNMDASGAKPKTPATPAK